ncbi:MAG: FMN-binding negative transcriptional regulator [Saprospiraceae bacterium]
MYTPKRYNNEDINAAIAFMQRYSFGTIITSNGDRPTATHLPFIITKKGDNILLKSHFARANSQSINIEEKQILTIFSEPHAYISPKHYESQLNVPTWNYISVHAYGKASIINSEDDVISLLEQTIKFFDASYLVQWKKLPSDFKTRMIKGIIGFEIEITELQFKEKLSQNKSKADQGRIINSFNKDGTDHEKQIAAYMEKFNKKIT